MKYFYDTNFKPWKKEKISEDGKISHSHGLVEVLE